MSGSDARRGFRYQDLYLVLRLLPHIREVLRTVWRTSGNEVFAALDADSLRFGLETKASGAPADSADAPWDITIANGTEEEVIEAKSGVIQRTDRLVFWQRLRKTAGAQPRRTTLLVPALVMDPATESSEKWRGLRDAALSFAGSVPLAAPTAPVRTSKQLLDEALFALCSHGGTAAVALPEALRLLTQLRLHEQRGASLQEEVERQLAALFPDVPISALAGSLRDWLDSRATATGDTQKLFGLSAPLREISLLREATTLDRGTWRRWLDLRNEWRGIVRTKATGRLGVCGGTIPVAEVQPEIVSALTGACGGKLLLGPGGAGKTTLLVIVDGDRTGVDESWLVPAANLSESEIDDLAAAVRFTAALLGTHENIRVAVDALDEVENTARRERWGAVLARLAVHERIEVTATARSSDFERDRQLRTHLESWPKLDLKDWPEDLVRGLLSKAGYALYVKPTLLSLLRTPILLDLFWRTFVDAHAAGAGSARLPITRHQLLSTFWSDRLIRSPRHATLSNRPACFDLVFAAAARSLGGFKPDALDAEVLAVLASEAVLIDVGQLRPQWQFRHPLLRDFALAQWCLASNSADEVASRWVSIASAIARQGALRAIMEAVSDDTGSQDYPNIRFEVLLETFLFHSDESQSALLRSLAALPASSMLDPTGWLPAIQRRLPGNFGAELVGASRRETNLSWAIHFANWPDGVEWLDEAFVPEVNLYVRLFLTGRHQATEHARNRTQGAHLARSLRRWSESTRFRGAFERDGRYQKHLAIEPLAALLPGRETLSWLAREVSNATWLTQTAILENLRLVAHADPEAAAGVYRAVVGLHAAGDRWVLDEELWGRDISYTAFDLSLTGPNAQMSLLATLPEHFLPVAVEIAEAIHWRDEERRQVNEQDSAFLEAIRGLPQESPTDERPDLLENLINDISSWQFETRSSPCGKAISETLEQQAQRSAEHFASRLSPSVRKSRLASVHNSVLETAASHSHAPAVQRLLAGSLADRRLFHAPGLLPALERAITAAWENLSAEQRAALISNIESTAESRSHYQGPLARRMLLAAIPAEALNPEQRLEADAYRERQLRRIEWESRPKDLAEEFQGWQRDEHTKRVVAEWPQPIDGAKLAEFHLLYSALQGLPSADAKNTAIRAQALMLEIFPSLSVDPHAWDSEAAVWMWHALRDLLQTLRKPTSARTAQSETLLRAAAELALQRLKAGAIPTTQHAVREGEPRSRDTAWLGALAAANEALVHPEVIDSVALATRFGEAVATRWEQASSAEQVDILHHITFARHWTRPGPLRTLAEGRLWTDSTDAGPLAAGLALIPHMEEPRRESVLRAALNRMQLSNAEKFARDVGRLLGEYAMVVDGQGQRAGLVTLSDECVSTPDKFPLLADVQTARVFLSQFAFGMKTQAKHYADHLELARDFGRWNLAAWRQLHRLPPANDDNTTGVSLFAHYWLGGSEEPSHPFSVRQRWWQELTPLREEIVIHGGARDVSHYYFLFHNGKLLDLCGTGEIFSSVESLLLRLAPLLQAKLISLEQTTVDDPDPRHWREALDRAVDAMNWFRVTGGLDRPEDAETAHRLLSKLSAQPFNNGSAKDALHRLVS